ncbi:Protein tyrosine/serine phosphatase [Klenkia marina]|uniref:Protein tyrosine/serine phosphatase n=1 Tax=Klenkia marina TaxID=1960309 RepID=A0A1G4XV67_9ACTN|nr:tyrosine-protein phosphatase [Klenkia marina]SCX45086.1 Protein tyrosine/serine phosphatase [Klenkia marina]
MVDARWIPLAGTANTRDLGGLPLAGGGTTVPGRVLRSDDLQELTRGDVELLTGQLGLTDVVDLRTSAEVRMEGRGPLREVGSVTHRHFSLIPEVGEYTDVFADDDAADVEVPEDWVETLLPRTAAPGDEDESPSVKAYLGYLSDGADNVVGALRAVTTAPGAAVVHCAAGKDRTGVVCALALSVAGVAPELVVADYAQTAERIEGVVAKLAARPTYAEDMTRRDVASHTPRAETMRRVLELLDERHGGATGWLTAHGFGADDQAALRAKLTQA